VALPQKLDICIRRKNPEKRFAKQLAGDQSANAEKSIFEIITYLSLNDLVSLFRNPLVFQIFQKFTYSNVSGPLCMDQSR
jgi:hypothetical protein